MKKILLFLIFFLAPEAPEANAQATCKMVYVCQNISQNCQYITVCD